MSILPFQWLSFEKPIMEVQNQIDSLAEKAAEGNGRYAAQIEDLELKKRELQREVFSHLTDYQKVQLARHVRRPYTLDYVSRIFEDFVELHGDRRFGDDNAVVAGTAKFHGMGVLVVGHQKGRTTRDRQFRNFAMAHPEGYRKSGRLMELAERLGSPIVVFVDTPCAACLADAENRGICEAIAASQMLMFGLRVPIIVLVVGEGGSGGAIAVGVGDVIVMLEYSIYSVIPPEGCASIVWRDASFADRASEALKLTASSALQLGVIDEVLEEPLGGAHEDPIEMACRIEKAIERHLIRLLQMDPDRLLEERYRKFRRMGIYGVASP